MENTLAGEDENINLALSDISNEIGFFEPFHDVANNKKLNLRYGFKLGKVNFLINKMVFSEVVRNYIIYPIPNMPEHVLGLINLRGMLVPVFDIKKYLEQPEKTGDKTLLVLERGEKIFAINIDDLPKTINLDEDDLLLSDNISTVHEKLKNFINDIYILNGKEVWLEINYDDFIKNIIKENRINNYL